MERSSLLHISENICAELRLAESGRTSSFPFIHNPLPLKRQSSLHTVQVLVIGGTVCKKGLVEKRGDTYHLSRYKEKLLPIFHSRDDFLAFCREEIDPAISPVAVNFAFPIQPVRRDDRLDGILLSGMKEHEFIGLIGEPVGQAIEEDIKHHTGKDIRISLANDTVCLLLSGRDKAEALSLVAGVIGTGINIAFFSSETEVINTEAANFNKFPLSQTTRLIDEQSKNPGKALFEKEIAGGYLYQHYNLLTANSLTAPLSSTQQLDIIAAESSAQGRCARELLSHSAQLTAALLCGVVLYKNTPLTCMIEGSLFWRGFEYNETVVRTIQEIEPPHTVQFIKVDDSPLLGAARLVL